MTQFNRFAIYYAPEAGPLAEFGARWLGWDLASGQAVAHLEDVAVDPAPLTETPRRYGFHATIKPPFRLAEGQSMADLQEAVEAFCTRQAPVTLDGLALTPLGRFLALTVTGDPHPVDALAEAAVKALDPYRAPLSEEALARRRQAGLSERQEALLQRWGYPYVMDQFRFHMTLTGRLDKAQRAEVQAALAPVLSPILPHPFVIRDLCLVGEDAEGFFHLIHRHALSGRNAAST